MDKQESRFYMKQMERQIEGQTNRQRDRHKGRQRDIDCHNDRNIYR